MMRRRSPSPTPPPPPSPNCKVEAGMKEMNSNLCSAMFGLVLSDEAYRSYRASRLLEVQAPTLLDSPQHLDTLTLSAHM